MDTASIRNWRRTVRRRAQSALRVPIYRAPHHREQDVGETEPDRSAKDADGHGLDQELEEDRAAAGAERLARPDLLRALPHAHKRDVHDPYGPHEQRETRHKEPGKGDSPLDGVEFLLENRPPVDVEVIALSRDLSAHPAHETRQFLAR